MDSPSRRQLKDEINKANEQEHDLAKWKLAVAAALGVAAFGITKDSQPSHWLLLLVPFVCAYIDLYAYQYQLRIMALAQFLRRDQPEDDPVLRQYELACLNWRNNGAFSLGTGAGLGSSILASVAGPIFYFLVPKRQPDSLLVPTCWAVYIWLFGLFLIIFLYVYFRLGVKKIES